MRAELSLFKTLIYTPPHRIYFRLVKKLLFQKKLKTSHRILNEIRLVNSRYFLNEIFLSNPVSKFPCQPILPTPGSFSFPKIPTLASLYLYKLLLDPCLLSVHINPYTGRPRKSAPFSSNTNTHKSIISYISIDMICNLD